MLNQQTEDSRPQFLPFLFDVRIGFPTKPSEHQQQQSVDSTNTENPVIDLTNKSNHLSKSNSLTHFNSSNSSTQNSPSVIKTNERIFHYGNVNTNSSSAIGNNPVRYSPPNSPSSVSTNNEEFGYNLQLDYWTIGPSLSSTFSTPTMLSNINSSINIKNSNSLSNTNGSFSNSGDQVGVINSVINNPSLIGQGSKTSKSSTKALFKSLHIYRSQLIKTTLNNTSLQSSSMFNSNLNSAINMPTGSGECQHVSQNLTIIYVIKEKKQKSIFFSFFLFE
jgi:hypothetical protein